MNIRRILLIKDIVPSNHADVAPVTRVAACALILNPMAGSPSGAFDELMASGAQLGDLLVRHAMEILPRPIVAYGKGAIVGVAGDIDHAAAILHPRMGKPIRDAIGGGEAVIPSNAKVGGPGTAIDIPIGHKDDAWSFDEIDTMTIMVPTGPRPNEIVVILALADGGRLPLMPGDRKHRSAAHQR